MKRNVKHAVIGFGMVIGALVQIAGAEIVRWGHVWTSSSNPSSSLNEAGQKNAHTIVPEKGLRVSQVAIYCGTSKMGSPVYRVGVQEDDGTTNHYPSGVWVGDEANYATTSLPDLSAWNVLTLPAEAALTKGVRYHLVVETVTADASNYGSIVRNIQSPLRTFRVNDGVYDAFMGKEVYKNAAWSRVDAFPIVAIDTNAVCSIGQPWQSQSTYYGAFASTRCGQIFTCNAPGSQDGRFLLKAMGMQVTFNNSPADNLRIHLAQYPDMTELASSILVVTNKLASGLVMTNLSADASVVLRNGSQYILYCESTNIVKGSTSNYKVVDCVGSTQYVGAASATFQGTNAYLATSADGVTWVKQFQNKADDDLVFELWLEPKPFKGLVISVR